MKRLIFCSIVLTASSAMLAGCASNLTAPLDAVPVTDMTSYFWSANSRIDFDSDRLATRDSGGYLLVSDTSVRGQLTTTLHCRVSADSIFAEDFRYGSIFDLGDGVEEFIEGDVNTQSPYHPGGLVLLRSDPVVDSSWRAGTLLAKSPSYKLYAIEARLLGRLDTLTVGRATFTDVLAVRYARELSNGSVDSITVPYVPYWVVFYARGHGPVMFDRYQVGMPIDRRMIMP